MSASACVRGGVPTFWLNLAFSQASWQTESSPCTLCPSAGCRQTIAFLGWGDCGSCLVGVKHLSFFQGYQAMWLVHLSLSLFFAPIYDI